MTEAAHSLLDSLSRSTITYDTGRTDINENNPDDPASGPDYAPATWLDALMVDERSRPDQPLGKRIPAPSDDAGLYPMFLRLVD
ncbi:hypothetical protein ASE36_08000 [Rhizobium sp. Root274]|uniref:hypothetical protein n=1 Tax=unclassified Rhizobium TaxID=2613769 RepID=UPI000715DD83|nr:MULTISPECIES: hypothetical protein [unclassified Rhizobium]KQW32122.1 hypothetical protein ASC71_08010 [Rhizobium sp. Root1240]KRD33661.1 hypothetical protein ASE36_08000 [Rhizobium sp. Root274]